MNNDAMNQPTVTANPFAALSGQYKAAISYIRVSTRRQAERGGGDDEGFSIPAQRDGNAKKAASIGAVIVKTFIDKGASAKSADRKDLQNMLEYIAESKGRFHYLIVNKIDRLARNRADDVAISAAVRDAGMQLVSANEAIDETPAGMLLHGIMSSIAEFYSLNLATEVKKGMNEKAKKGGTVSKVPLGYVNVRKVDELGREYRTVEIDEERARLMKMAFEKYATGEYFMDGLAEELAALGLTTRNTPKMPSKPIDGKGLGKLLAHPYYKGVVMYKGAEYAGNHEAIIDAETWQTVQDVCATHVNGERSRDHDHFLKSTVYCGSCGSRLLVNMTKNKFGNIYPYFVCIGRHNKTTDCKQKALSIYEVEAKIEELYEKISLPESVRKPYETFLLETIAELEKEAKIERAALIREKNKIERKQVKLLEAHFADAVPLNLLKEQQDILCKEWGAIERQLTAYEANSAVTAANLRSALDVIEDCGKYYKSAPDSIKRAFNQAIFEKLLIMPDGTPVPEYTEPFNSLLNAPVAAAQGEKTTDTQHDKDKTENAQRNEAHTFRLSDILKKTLQHPSHFFGGCWSKDFLVELRGIEPLTF